MVVGRARGRSRLLARAPTATVAGSMTDDTAPETALATHTALAFDPVPPLATALGLPPGAIAAVIALLDEGNTVPFIARYRKERTGGLDEVQIRAIEERRDLPGRARDAARRDPRVGRRAGQAHARARGEAARRDEQGRARGPLPAVRPRRRPAPRSPASRASSRSPTACSRRAPTATRLAEAAAFVTEGVTRPPTRRSPARATSSPRRSPTPPRCARSCAASTPSTASWSRRSSPARATSRRSSSSTTSSARR